MEGPADDFSTTIGLNTYYILNYNMAEIFHVGILDYTPLEYTRYREQLAIDVLTSALKESMPEDMLLGYTYVRGLRDEIPDKDFDMFLIAGSPLSTVNYSRNLDRALNHIREIISDVPVFGICFGLHAIANITGNGSVMIKEFEIGPKEVALYSDIKGVVKDKRRDYPVFPVNHFYKITNGNGALKVVGVSNEGIQIADATEFFDGNPVMGVQFHPEFAASWKGWYTFKKIFEKTLDMVISGEYSEATIGPIIDALDKTVRKRLLETVYDPESLVGRKLSEEQKTLLMSLFHNIDFRQKLLGKRESERTYDELKGNSRAVIGHFIRRAVKVRNARKQKAIPKKPVVRPGTQMKLKLPV